MSRELRKCKRLVQTMPVDMTEYYGKWRDSIAIILHVTDFGLVSLRAEDTRICLL
ncbi:hypothetical protein E2C01_093821 [Portunus trituberculatus]|uniref:Uncharacterized protein n=1 Tax=Portunus trituberculatus TaxID=210409 RepID=A0A5B7JNR2_PORTR|nr:hypothetical protein [Portunus trituberculatus]